MRKPVIKFDTVWYIYALVDPRYDSVRYIGFSKFPESRLATHIEESAKGGGTHKCKWITALLQEGHLPVMRILEEGRGEDWQSVERFWIKFYREEIGANLTNATDGGDGGKVHNRKKFVMTNEQKSRISATMRSLWSSPDYRARMVESAESAGKRTEVRTKRSESAKLRYQDPSKRAWTAGARQVSEATRQKMSESQKQAWRTRAAS